MTTTPRTWVVGEVVTAAELNTEIRDQFNSFFGAWSIYTVAWTATTAPAIGNGTLLGRYLQVGRRVDYHIDMVCGSTTTYGSGGFSYSLPATAAATGTGNRVGNAHCFVSTNRYGGQNIVSTTATATSPFFPTSSSVTTMVAADSTHPITWASGAQMRITGTYETA